jgi:IclR family acetate operon transcriptional repressor
VPRKSAQPVSAIDLPAGNGRAEAAIVADVATAGAQRARDRGGIQSVDRALRLLEALAQATGDGISLTELSQTTHLNISTCHHLLATLARSGYVAQVPGKRAYRLGARVLGLSQAYLNQVDLPRRAEPLVEAINARTGETVHLAVLQHDSIVTLLKREGRHAVRVDTGALGTVDAIHATATGKAMLAWLPEDEAQRLLARQGMTRFTPRTIVDAGALFEELRLVRRNGFAVDNEEFQPGVICIGAVVRNHTGAVVGALSCSAPTLRASEEHLARIREEIVAAARQLSDFVDPVVATGGGQDVSSSPIKTSKRTASSVV